MTKTQTFAVYLFYALQAFQALGGLSSAAVVYSFTWLDGLKWTQNQNGFIPFVCHRKWSKIVFSKMQFWPIFDPLLVPKRPVVRVFWVCRRAKMGHHVLKAD